ncbi:hypothetical protein A1O3_00537 [Capronia epimyces CBS 606.96]|uniref:Fungal-specific transcription factor domain-containing protein n=1 Tax=Capronia epimyces CBS 606.96 TaxID=1182542 RepID=W9YGH0_9EURO|nr:uncharacterized protein A1O3_00537 [Capronia epimyces CBS 606.96]EXJ91987.1 hypothetical protein A1O3_00537 [Capronia epimyces CBS 606.96]
MYLDDDEKAKRDGFDGRLNGRDCWNRIVHPVTRGEAAQRVMHEESGSYVGIPQRPLAHLDRHSKFARYDPILLSYYEAVICSTSTLLDDEKNNPYRHVLLPMALQSPGIYHATLAISAHTLCLARSEYAVIALEHRQQALKRLITILSREECDDSEMDEVLGLVLMLCWFEISDGCNPSWVTHLKGFRTLLHRHRRTSANGSLHSLSLKQFFVRYFDFHLVLAKTAFRVDEEESTAKLPQPPVIRSGLLFASCETDESIDSNPVTRESDDTHNLSSSTALLSLHMPLDSMDDIDPYMGFSNSLLLLINEITELGPMATRLCNQPTVTSHARRLKASLENLDQRPPDVLAFSSNSKLGTSRRAFVTTAETYRLGAFVLLHEILWRSYPAASAASHVITIAERDEAIRSILKLVDTHHKDMINTATLPLWPLFLAGCCVDLEEDRMTVLRLFEIIEQRKRFGNVPPARKVMEMVWRQRDLGRDGRRPARRKNVEQYEWERASTLLGGWKISLT